MYASRCDNPKKNTISTYLLFHSKKHNILSNSSEKIVCIQIQQYNIFHFLFLSSKEKIEYYLYIIHNMYNCLIPLKERTIKGMQAFFALLSQYGRFFVIINAIFN